MEEKIDVGTLRFKTWLTTTEDYGFKYGFGVVLEDDSSVKWRCGEAIDQNAPLQEVRDAFKRITQEMDDLLAKNYSDELDKA
ncbi:MAG: hypothetical protein GY800_08985 [Planctomycetes bacterium]|nr:hypothetical protein [Planctomycetota bacterium]